MSRKSRRNRSDAPPIPVPAKKGGNALIAAVFVLVAAFLGLTLYFTSRGPAPERHAESTREALASVGAPTTGRAQAPVHIVEFLDPACETCALFYPYVKRAMADNPGRIRLSVRHVAFHKGAETAVRALEAARAQGRYWEALEALLANQRLWVSNHRVIPEAVLPALERAGLDLPRLRGDMDSPEVTARMERDLADARDLRVSKTPEYFVNGRQMPSFGLEELHALIGEELRRTAQVAAATQAR